MPVGKKKQKANGLKTAKQDQFQSKCRILLSVREEKSLFLNVA